MTTTTKSHETILVTGATGTVGSEVVKQLSSYSELTPDQAEAVVCQGHYVTRMYF